MSGDREPVGGLPVTPDAEGPASTVAAQLVERMVDDALSWEEWRELLRQPVKDPGRFRQYLAALQKRTGFAERILLRLSDHLYVVEASAGRVVKCDCGQVFGDYRVNWKLAALVHVRSIAESIGEVYRRSAFAPEPGWSEVREFYCPGCAAQLAVEVVPPGYPFIFEFLPDLDTFYRDWLAQPLPDESADWYADHTAAVIARWAD